MFPFDDVIKLQAPSSVNAGLFLQCHTHASQEGYVLYCAIKDMIRFSFRNQPPPHTPSPPFQ